MKKRLFAILLNVLLVCGMAAGAMADSYATIKGGRLNMRAYASFQSSVVAVYGSGTNVIVKDMTDPNWYYCEGPDGRMGYMYSQYLEVHGGSSGTSPIPDGSTAYVYSLNGLGVNLRLGPGSGYEAIGVCPVGTQVTVLTGGANWSYVDAAGVKGFIMTEYLTTVKPSDPSYTAYITSANGLNVQVRTGAGTKYKVIAAFPVGQEVKVLYKNGNWAHIQVANKTGYIMSKFLTKTKPTPITPPKGAAVVISGNGLSVRLRKGPGTSYKTIASYKPGTLVTILEEGSKWSRVRIGKNTGYMMTSYILKSK